MRFCRIHLHRMAVWHLDPLHYSPTCHLLGLSQWTLVFQNHGLWNLLLLCEFSSSKAYIIRMFKPYVQVLMRSSVSRNLSFKNVCWNLANCLLQADCIELPKFTTSGDLGCGFASIMSNIYIKGTMSFMSKLHRFGWSGCQGPQFVLFSSVGCALFGCSHDLDNILLEKLENVRTMYAVYELEALVLTGEYWGVLWWSFSHCILFTS